MAKKLADAALVSALTSSQCVMVQVNGVIKQITLADLRSSLNTSQEELLQSIAWYVDLETSSSTTLPMGGNTSMYKAYEDMRGDYILNNNGYAAKLSEVNGRYYADGTAVTVTGAKGQFMTYLPEMWILAQALDGGGTRLWKSLVPLGAGSLHIKAHWAGKFKAYVTGGKMYSIPDVVPTGSLTVTAFWNAAQALGNKWGLAGYQIRKHVALDHYFRYGKTDIESSIGAGLQTNYDYVRNIVTGQTLSLGKADGRVAVTGSDSNTYYRNHFEGLEDYAGQVWEMAADIVSDGAFVKIHEENKCVEDPAAAHIDYRRIAICAEGSGSYIKSMQLGEDVDLVPKTVGGSSNTYYADGYWYAADAKLWLFGGGASNGSFCGLVAAVANSAWSYASSNSGARLAWYGPEPQIVSGAALEAM